MITTRCLSDESELIAWAQLCAECFSQKSNPPPPEHFLDHFFNDPWKDINLIFVSFDNESRKMVSSVRIFRRALFLNREIYHVFGLGEVCTLPSHRNRGIARDLLSYAIRNVENSANIEFGFILHAADWVRPFYQQLGFKSIVSGWSSIRFNDHFRTKRKIIVKLAPLSLISEKATNLNISVSKFLNGAVSRSVEYTSSWIQSECNNRVLVLVQGNEAEDNNSSNVVSGESVLAYCSIQECRPHGHNKFQLIDFGIDHHNINLSDDKSSMRRPESLDFDISQSLALLLSNGIPLLYPLTDARGSFEVIIPRPLACLLPLHPPTNSQYQQINEMDAQEDAARTVNEKPAYSIDLEHCEDECWMVRPRAATTYEQFTNICIWPIDNF